MFKSDSIRPISLGIAKKDNKILVGIGYDKVKKQTFYRALGGGIEQRIFLPIKGKQDMKSYFFIL